MKKMMMLAMTALTVAVSNAPALVGAATTDADATTATAFVHSAHVPVAMYENGTTIYADITYVSTFSLAGTTPGSNGITYYNYDVDGRTVLGSSLIS